MLLAIECIIELKEPATKKSLFIEVANKIFATAMTTYERFDKNLIFSIIFSTEEFNKLNWRGIEIANHLKEEKLSQRIDEDSVAGLIEDGLRMFQLNICSRLHHKRPNKPRFYPGGGRFCRWNTLRKQIKGVDQLRTLASVQGYFILKMLLSMSSTAWQKKLHSSRATSK